MRNRSIRSAVTSMAVAVPTEGLVTAEKMSKGAVDLDELLLRARDGNETAFGELVARFERMVHGHVFRMTHDEELSKDLSQDVFLQMWKVLPALTTAHSLASWLKKVSVNAVISHWRQQESQRRRIQALASAFPPKEPTGPAAVLIEEEDRDQVRAALEMLPPDLRSVLTLRVYEGQSYEELSDTLGLEVGTVRSRLFRARQTIKDILERWRQHDKPQDRRARAAED